MDNVSNIRRLSTRKADRHLVAVPDDHPAMWEAEELQRLGRLRQLAISTGAPDAALRIIGAAANADAAIAALAEAGLMPSDEESVEDMLSWFTPLLEPGSDQLAAEVCAAEFIGAIRRAGSGEAFVPVVLCDLISDVAESDRLEAMAMLRALSVVGPDESRVMAAAAAARRVSAGLPDVPWADGLGTPRRGRAFGYADIYGEQQSMVITFAYGRKRHAIVVLIDYLLGGGIKTCYVADYTDRLRTEYRRIAQDPALLFSDFDEAQARSLLLQALTRPPCPTEPDQVANVENYLDVIWARADLMARTRSPRHDSPAPATRVSTAQKGGPAKRAPAPRNVHRIKVTLRGTKPAIWRRFEVPSDINLKRLHDVIQAGFGWENSHLYVFETPQGRYGIPDPDGELDHRNAAYKKLSAVADWPGDKFR